MSDEEQKPAPVVRVHCLVCGSSWLRGSEPVHDAFCRVSTGQPESIELAVQAYLRAGS